MSDQALYQQLFNPTSPAKLEKKLSNTDVMNSLFSMQLPSVSKNQNNPPKNKNEDDIIKYLSSVKKNNNTATNTYEKYKYDQPKKSTVEKIKQPNHTDINKSAKPKIAETITEKKEVKYMPNIVDPFAKKEEKITKQTQLPAKKIEKTSQSKNSQTNPITQKSKVQAKQQKIERKQKINTNGGMIPKQKISTDSAIPKVNPQKQRIKSEQINIKKKVKRQSSSQSSSSSSSEQSSSQSSPQEQDWRSHLRKVTGYNPQSSKFRERDRIKIQQSGVERMFGEDKYSYKMGKLEEEQDMRLQELKRQKLLSKKHQHRH